MSEPYLSQSCSQLRNCHCREIANDADAAADADAGADAGAGAGVVEVRSLA